jgi:hypothetical protein
MISKGHMMSKVVFNSKDGFLQFGVATGFEFCCLAQ